RQVTFAEVVTVNAIALVLVYYRPHITDVARTLSHIRERHPMTVISIHGYRRNLKALEIAQTKP
ncbi:TPA: hypothetical protein NNP44_004601, partial [Salmonella enterica]|nr:hypothetical protein [Salmonella enterica]